MTKSKRRGPKKIGRTRKARSRRYVGGVENGVTAQVTDQVDGTQPAAANPAQVALRGDMVIADEYAKIVATPYTTFGQLAGEMPTDGSKHDKIVALLYLIKYHLDEGDKTRLQQEFIDTVKNINKMTKVDTDRINPLVKGIADAQGPFGPITPDNRATLLAYVNSILEQLKSNVVQANALTE